MSIWTFSTRRFIVIFAESRAGNSASVHSRSGGRTLGVAIDEVGMKTRQQLVREACNDATNTLLEDILNPLRRALKKDK